MQVLYQLSYAPRPDDIGDEGTRTPDILLAKQALYQLSYIPERGLLRLVIDAWPRDLAIRTRPLWYLS